MIAEAPPADETALGLEPAEVSALVWGGVPDCGWLKPGTSLGASGIDLCCRHRRDSGGLECGCDGKQAGPGEVTQVPDLFEENRRFMCRFNVNV